MKILVCGDAMVDCYWLGEANRMSPEAPVPIVKMGTEEERPGAAANVYENCKAMGAEVSLVSINVSRKIRVIGRHQQLLRIDYDVEPRPDELRQMRRDFEAAIPEAGIVIFSDYGKGALANVEELINLCAGKTILVDPKGHEYSKYHGVDLIKPNLDEMKELVGSWKTEGELEAKAQKLRIRAQIGAILLTQGADGMTLYTDDGMTEIHSKPVEVYDVCGAGDTAIAAVAVGLSRGMSLIDAATIANHAAGISVTRFGTTVVTANEVFGA